MNGRSIPRSASHKLRTKPLMGARFGAEIIDVDIRDEALFQSLEEALLRFGLLFFSGVRVSIADQLRLMAHFGPLFDIPHKPINAGSHPSIVRRSSIKNGDVGPIPFHFDQAYQLRPASLCSLYCLSPARIGGDTFFADMFAAYDALPGATKTALKRRRAFNHCNRPECGPVSGHYNAHPIFRNHPIANRNVLYVSRAMTKAVDGIPSEESAATLQFLFAHQERPEFAYVHRWAKNDFLIFDNRRIIHGRGDFSADETRIMRLAMALPEQPF